jgi:hypothetical protein
MAVITRIAVLILTIASFAAAQAGIARAATLPNDNFANATSISALPFSDSGDLSGATLEPGEPTGCSVGATDTVWYVFTAATDVVIKGDLNGSDSSVGVNYYRAVVSGLGGLDFGGCAGSGGSFQLSVPAGATYYFQVGVLFGQAANPDFQFHLQQVPPPANDDFANATQASALPFTDTVALPISATIEPGEPNPCSGGPPTGSVWYTFTPSASGSYTAQSFLEGTSTTLAAYQGTSLAGLTPVGCAQGTFSSLLNFQATAGVTYYIQAFGPWLSGGDFPLNFQLEATPPPEAGFFFQPSDPSVLDTVQFFDESFDPAQVGIRSETWDFGDGTTATGSSPAHQYTVDRDYTVRLTVTTTDGRTGSASQVVHVRTHDVAVAKFAVPTSASTGQTRRITVGVSDQRYPETVQVQLLKGNSQGGFNQIAALTQSIPVQAGNRTTPFSFNYTFTPGDAAVGKVTFEVVATIQDARDAFPGDNTAFASTAVH